MNRDDVERIVENVLNELSLDISTGEYPNARCVKLMYDGKVISEIEIDVTNKSGRN